MNTLIDAKKRPRRGIVMQLLAFMLLLLGSHSAMAVCTGYGGSATITLPATTVVPRDMAAGQPLTAWIYMPTAANFTCPFPASSYYTRGVMSNIPSMALAGPSYADSVTGATFRLFSTGVQGIGMAVMLKASAAAAPSCYGTLNLDNSLSGSGIYYNNLPPSGWTGVSCAGNIATTGSYSGQMAVRLYRIPGDIVPGPTYSGTLNQICAYAGGPSSSSNMSSYLDTAPCTQVYLTSTQIQVAACTTPDVKVDLGSHNVNDADLAAIGSTTTAVAVNIKLNNCPAGMNSVSYRIEPNTTVINQALSVVSLDGAATASGVGVQLLNSAGTAPFALSTSTFTAFAGYNKTTGGDYVIPLMARYYRTGNLSPGTATSSMVFTMQYL